MIYVSSSCLKYKKINDVIKQLVAHDIKNIELSGGTDYYTHIEDDLLYLKRKHNINYLVHNYFPPPQEAFVINLGSLDDNIFNQSINHIKKAVELSGKLESEKYGIHAAFMVDISSQEIGGVIEYKRTTERKSVINKFCEGFNIITDVAKEYGITLYVENNVVSVDNYNTFNQNTFLLTDVNSYLELKQRVNFNLLLDVGHLFVSCKVLNKNFEEEFNKLFTISDYIHLSNNDGFSDQNDPLANDSYLYSILKQYSFVNKTVTLEIYSDMEQILKSYELVVKLF